MSCRIGLIPPGADRENPDLQAALRLARAGGRHLNLELDVLDLKLKLLVARVDGSGLEFHSDRIHKIRQRYARLRFWHINPHRPFWPANRKEALAYTLI